MKNRVKLLILAALFSLSAGMSVQAATVAVDGVHDSTTVASDSNGSPVSPANASTGAAAESFLSSVDSSPSASLSASLASAASEGGHGASLASDPLKTIFSAAKVDELKFPNGLGNGVNPKQAGGGSVFARVKSSVQAYMPVLKVVAPIVALTAVGMVARHYGLGTLVKEQFIAKKEMGAELLKRGKEIAHQVQEQGTLVYAGQKAIDALGDESSVKMLGGFVLGSAATAGVAGLGGAYVTFVIGKKVYKISVHSYNAIKNWLQVPANQKWLGKISAGGVAGTIALAGLYKVNPTIAGIILATGLCGAGVMKANAMVNASKARHAAQAANEHKNTKDMKFITDNLDMTADNSDASKCIMSAVGVDGKIQYLPKQWSLVKKTISETQYQNKLQAFFDIWFYEPKSTVAKRMLILPMTYEKDSELAKQYLAAKERFESSLVA